MKRFKVLLVIVLALAGCGRSNGVTEHEILTNASTTVLAAGGRFSNPKWSPDGRKILVEHFEQWEYLEIRDESGELLESQKLQRGGDQPQWMGSNPIYRESRKSGPGRRSTSILAFGSPDAPLLTLEGSAYFSWTRDGRIAAVALNPGPGTVGEEQKPVDVYLFTPETEDIRFLWSAGSTILSAYMSPSGRYVAVEYQDGDTAWVAALIEVDTGHSRELWRVPWPGRTISALTWSPDEEFIGARYSAQSESGFYLLDPMGQAPPVRISATAMVRPDWSPAGDRIVYGTVGYPGENELRIFHLPTDWREQVEKLREEQQSQAG